MEPISDMMAAQKMLLQKREVLGLAKKKKKKPKQLVLVKFKGFTSIRHYSMDSILSDNTLGKQELKVLLFIFRLTVGLSKNSMDLKRIDFSSAGIGPSHISEVLKILADKQWILITETPKVTYYSIHKSRLIKNMAVNNSRLNRLIHDKLLKYGLI